MVNDEKRIKIFNKLLKEFTNDLEIIYKTDLKLKAKDIKFLDTFREEVNFVKEDFLSSNPKVLKNISLCKKLELDNKPLRENSNSIWKHLHNLYLLSLNDTDNQESACKQIVQIKQEDSKDVMTDLVTDISSQLSESLNGKDLSTLNPMDLFGGIMQGKVIEGIDFSQILKVTAEKIQHKVESGEVDIEQLKNQASSMLGEDNLKKLSELN